MITARRFAYSSEEGLAGPDRRLGRDQHRQVLLQRAQEFVAVLGLGRDPGHTAPGLFRRLGPDDDEGDAAREAVLQGPHGHRGPLIVAEVRHHVQVSGRVQDDLGAVGVGTDNHIIGLVQVLDPFPGQFVSLLDEGADHARVFVHDGTQRVDGRILVVDDGDPGQPLLVPGLPEGHVHGTSPVADARRF
jgi:hypothetical protein